MSAIFAPIAPEATVDAVFSVLILEIMRGDVFVARVKISQRKILPYTFRRVGWLRAGALFVAAMSVAGCSAPAGKWQLVRVDPPGAPFPITQIEFGDGGAYSAKGKFTQRGEPAPKTQTTTGKFKRDGGFFHLAPTGRAAFGLRTYLRLDGKMVMTLQPPGRDWKVKGIFERVTPIDSRLLDPERPITPASLHQERGRSGLRGGAG